MSRRCTLDLAGFQLDSTHLEVQVEAGVLSGQRVGHDLIERGLVTPSSMSAAERQYERAEQRGQGRGHVARQSPVTYLNEMLSRAR
jgi:hypothetical protein